MFAEADQVGRDRCDGLGIHETLVFLLLFHVVCQVLGSAVLQLFETLVVCQGLKYVLVQGQ